MKNSQKIAKQMRPGCKGETSKTINSRITVGKM